MRTLGKTKLKVCELGFGGAPVGYLNQPAESVRRILNLLLDRGVTVIDTAACYPCSESLIGQTVSHRRDDYVLVTKCGHRVEGVQGEEWSAQLIGDSIERSLRALETDRIDIVLLHSCGETVLRRGEAIEALLQAREEGKVRFVGYSGDNEAARFAASLEEVAVIETSVNICDQRNIDMVLPVAREHGVGVLAKRPMANAAWKDVREQKGIYQAYSEPYTKRLASMHLKPIELGVDGECSWAELALRFCLTAPGVDCALVGTTNFYNAQENVEAAARGPLPDETYERIRQCFVRCCPQEDAWQGLT